MTTRDEVDEGMRAVCGDCGRPKATGLEGVSPGTEEAKALCWSYLPTGTLCERLAIARLRSQLAAVERERDELLDLVGSATPWSWASGCAPRESANEWQKRAVELRRRIKSATPPTGREDGEPGAGMGGEKL